MTASAKFGGGYSISISPAAFAWLKDLYGPDAWEWSECQAYRAAALSGAEFALRHIANVDGIPEARVIIERIHVSAIDTMPDDVAYATAFAVWLALGVEGSLLPPLNNSHAQPLSGPPSE